MKLQRKVAPSVSDGRPHSDEARYPVRIAYLVSTYPAVSHTFIMREVSSLRQARFEVCVASINPPDRPTGQLTVQERREAETTFYIKQQGVRGAAYAHLSHAIRSPWSYFSALWFSLTLAGYDLGQLVFSLFYFTEALILGRWLKSQNVRHVHVHFANAAATVGLIASRIFPIEFSLSVHGPDEFFETRGLRLAEKIAGASFVRCIGNFARSQVMKLSSPGEWGKFEIARLGVDPAQFAPLGRHRHSETVEILCVGRLVPAKGQHVLLAAIGQAVKSVPNLRLRLVGDGPDRASLTREIAAANLGDHVFIEGNVNQDRIRDYYRTTDIFVLASFAEGIPVVLMEAMSMEIPCISTFVAGIPELIRNEVDGILVPPSDVPELTGAIMQLIKDPQLRRRLGAAGRRRVLEQFNLERNVPRLAQIFADRISERRSSKNSTDDWRVSRTSN